MALIYATFGLRVSKRGTVSPVDSLGHMFEDELDFFFVDALVFIHIVAVKGYLELLLLVTHQGQ